jgi:hypothetical protein
MPVVKNFWPHRFRAQTNESAPCNGDLRLVHLVVIIIGIFGAVYEILYPSDPGIHTGKETGRLFFLY